MEPVYHRALRWASGLPAYVSIRKLLLLTRSPPLRCLLNYLSGRYAACLLFSSETHPLQEYIGLTSRTLQQSWLESCTAQTTGTRYPSLRHPLSLGTQFLKAGETLENTHLCGNTANATSFPITILKLNGPTEGPQQHQQFLQDLVPNTILLYTDGSKATSQICGSGWTIYQQRRHHISQELESGYCCLGDKAEVYNAELHAI